MKCFNRLVEAFDIMTPIRRCIQGRTDNRPRDLYRCGSLGMFLVSLLYERKCLKNWSYKNKLLPECSVYYLVSLCFELGNF